MTICEGAWHPLAWQNLASNLQKFSLSKVSCYTSKLLDVLRFEYAEAKYAAIYFSVAVMEATMFCRQTLLRMSGYDRVSYASQLVYDEASHVTVPSHVYH